MSVESLSSTSRRARETAHRERLAPYVEPHLARRARGEKHPVHDFMFGYYSQRPAQLLRWHPGFPEEGTVEDVEARRPLVEATRRLLAATASRPAHTGCFGLHEWAMVYRAGAVRHAGVPLRLAPDALAAVVEATPVVCTHYDAFRFFTPEARPLNRHQPTHAAMPALEQPGCLHTNMDVYRWAYKLYPWTPGELLADAFLLARRIREVDMRASPYDLRALGFAPIAIETPEGRRAYRDLQQRFAREAAPLRARLHALYDALLETREA